MRISKRYFIVTAVLLAAYLLSACGGVVPQSNQEANRQAAIKVDAVEVAFTGVIEAMDGNTWTVNNQEITVDPEIVHDGPFTIGDIVKVEGKIDQDGVVQVTKVENPELTDSASYPDPVETQSPDALETQAPNPAESQDSVASSSSDDHNKTGMEDDDNETFGTVEAIKGDVWTIDGQDYLIADFTEIKGLIEVGDIVKVHVITNTDETLTIREVEQSTGFDDSSNGSNDDQNSSSSSYSDDSNDDSGDDSYSSGDSSSDDDSSHDSDDDHDSSSNSDDSSGSSSNEINDDD